MRLSITCVSVPGSRNDTDTRGMHKYWPAFTTDACLLKGIFVPDENINPFNTLTNDGREQRCAQLPIANPQCTAAHTTTDATPYSPKPQASPPSSRSTRGTALTPPLSSPRRAPTRRASSCAHGATKADVDRILTEMTHDAATPKAIHDLPLTRDDADDD